MNYPYDIVSLVKKQKQGDHYSPVTLAIEAHFIQEKEESPMKVFDNTFSRFSCNIISGGSGAVFFNIPIEALPGMRYKTNYAASEHLKPVKITSTDGENTGPAFTKRFVSGNLKGKTPIEVLLSDPIGGKETLNNQFKWLKENLSKYPNNQELMDAIVDASKVDITTLKQEDVSSTPTTIDILDIGCRPLRLRQREDGKCLIYEGKVIWDTTKKYPVSVIIKNYYAFVKQNEDKTLNVNLSSKDSDTEQIKDFNMTAEEWLHALWCMENSRDCFRMLHFNEGYKLAENAAAMARQKAKENRPQAS